MSVLLIPLHKEVVLETTMTPEVRPIATSSVWRRISTKNLYDMVKEKLAERLYPV